MIEDVDEVLKMYFEYAEEEPIIITDRKHFSSFKSSEKCIDLEMGLNTYKNYWVVLREDMPKNSEIIVMGLSDYIRLYQQEANKLQVDRK